MCVYIENVIWPIFKSMAFVFFTNKFQLIFEIVFQRHLTMNMDLHIIVCLQKFLKSYRKLMPHQVSVWNGAGSVLEHLSFKSHPLSFWYRNWGDRLNNIQGQGTLGTIYNVIHPESSQNVKMPLKWPSVY